MCCHLLILTAVIALLCEHVVHVTDVQLLAVVGACGCRMPCHCGCPHTVRYTQVWTVNLDDGTYLCGADGELLLTADGARIQVKQ